MKNTATRRSDIHAPGSVHFDPAAYELICAFYQGPSSPRIIDREVRAQEA